MQARYREQMATSQSAGLSKEDLSYPPRRPASSTSEKSDLCLQELVMLSFSPLVRLVQRWWLQRAERHYLICADIEQQRAREAQMNVAYYQKRAALARSELN
jgi:hypothetical protein